MLCQFFKKGDKSHASKYSPISLIRNRLLASLPAVPITLDTLLYGHDLLTFETNTGLHKTVLQFIKDTGKVLQEIQNTYTTE